MRNSGSVLEGQNVAAFQTLFPSLTFFFLQLAANSKAKMPLSFIMKTFRSNFMVFFPASIMVLIMLLAISAQASMEANQSWSEEPWKSSAEEGDGQNATAISSPLTFNLSGNEPSTLRLGSISMNFSDYVANPLSSELWVRTGRQWRQYEQIYTSNGVDLILYTPSDGNVDIYLVSYARSTINHLSFKLLAGYHLLRLTPEDSGRLFLIMALNNQPSNAVILDASALPQETSSSPLDVRSIPTGRAKVTIESERIKGYDVYLDGVFYSSDVSDGALDGITSFTIGADMTHTIIVSQRDKQGNIFNKNEHTKSFKRDTAYTLSIN